MVFKPGRQNQTKNIGLSVIKNACWKKEGAKKILTGNRGHYLIMEHAPAFLLFPENLFHPALGNLMEISTRHNSFLRVPGYATLIITVKMA